MNTVFKMQTLLSYPRFVSINMASIAFPVIFGKRYGDGSCLLEGRSSKYTLWQVYSDEGDIREEKFGNAQKCTMRK